MSQRTSFSELGERRVSGALRSRAGAFDNAQEIDKKLDEMFSVDTSGMYICKYCSRVSNKKSNIREHAEVHVDGLTFSCDFCS